MWKVLVLADSTLTVAYPPPHLPALYGSVFFIVYKGAKGLDLDETSLADAFAWALGLGGGIGLLMIPTVLPYMRKQIDAKFNEDGTAKPVSNVHETRSVQRSCSYFVLCGLSRFPVLFPVRNTTLF